METPSTTQPVPQERALLSPAFLTADFTIPPAQQDEPVPDTFLQLLPKDGWSKGMAWINGVALGRYWDVGPQHSLFVPGPWLRRGRNRLVLLELHQSSAKRAVHCRLSATP